MHRSKSTSQRGFSLVELMVALVVGLLITLGAFQLFLTGKQAFNHELAMAERQASLRFLVDSISYNIRSASYTDFVDGEGNVLSDSDELILSFEKDNSICPSDDVYQVKYFASDGSIKMSQSCGGAAFGSADSIVLGVGAINFYYFDSALGVRVQVTMHDDQGRLPDEVFNFRVANRSAVGKALELWGEES
ncbi:PilW family protein [Halomonas nitroreducens]|uniref:Prepilin-type N-terminal cleavage/methylation domain-containing protein n=1 Tax=Halomonas nitroreducens TaxID=447425 RepID=A0A3S0KPQ5_9GAMM|nr:prepilin-type N-terminal cleavage/methylation domain-containing protein [Halomonas nitroreducens]RTR01456.1 prepilin-type N-terminal cleavage/methylation domain-containing protein [Halomonas nitroreducens]